MTDLNLVVNRKLLNNFERAFAIPKDGQADSDELRLAVVLIRFIISLLFASSFYITRDTMLKAEHLTRDLRKAYL